jgi:hypothetical protein
VSLALEEFRVLSGSLVAQCPKNHDLIAREVAVNWGYTRSKQRLAPRSVHPYRFEKKSRVIFSWRIWNTAAVVGLAVGEVF